MRRVTISDMQALAAKRNGRCLSETYVNAHTRLAWRCDKRHEWLATPNSLKRGTWCPYCAGKRRTIDDMREVAAKLGGKCVSAEYIDADTKLIWECAEGHRWEAIPNSVWRGSWCPYCAGRHKTIENMHELARRRGGQCLSVAYVSDRGKLLWQCTEGHSWESSPNSIIQGTWCPYCAGKHKTIEDMRELAADHGGKCLSPSYVNDKINLLWECRRGHRWRAIPSSIVQGTWCPYCAGRHKTIENMRELAKTRGGRCISDRYVDGKMKLLWQCTEGHRWEAAPAHILSGSWCPHCAGKSKGIVDLRNLAARRGGKCLSRRYVGMRRKYLWECAHGHRWTAVPYSVVKGHWCPQCSSGLGERICRAFFEQLFGKAFPRSRPEWLISETGNRMELDGYCESLALAFEHQGEHHYSNNAHYVRDRRDLEDTQQRDKLKIEACDRHGVTLITIPEIPQRIQLTEIKAFIRDKCEQSGFSLPLSFNDIAPDLSDAYITNIAEEALEELKSIASAKGGRCLSDQYVNNETQMLWECSEGHRWRAKSNNIRHGKWCPFCSGRRRTKKEICDFTNEMNHLANQRGGKCLSNECQNLSIKLLWECAEGHRWVTTPSAIRRGTWCPYCAGRHKTIENMRELAKTRGGRCISDRYVDGKMKLLWQCEKGHQWEAPATRLLSGAWCPYCAGVFRKTIDDMHAIAGQRGGKCLSRVYVNTETKLLWQCAKGHQWEAKPAHIRRGSWCPYCAGQHRTIENMHQLA